MTDLPDPTQWLAVFLILLARVAGAVALFPGFSGRMIPVRVKLMTALAVSAAVSPLAGPQIALPSTLAGFGAVLAAESLNGLVFGFGLRALVLGLSFAGSVAANAMSLSQIAGPGALPEATPALASVLTLAAITLALALGLHVYLVGALADSYRILPAGTLPSGAGIAAWVIAQARIVFEMGVTFAAPFLLTAVAYNVALGALNRAMPQLMVVLVGAPAITGASLILLFLCAPLIAERWSMLALETLSRPFGAMP